MINRLWLSVLLVALASLASLSSSVHAEDTDEVELQCVSADKVFEVWSDHKIDQTRCQWITERIRKAYKFVSQQEAWKNQDALWAKPLQIRALGSMKSKALGYAQGADLMVVRDSYLDDELSEGTLAHELTHIQDARQLRGAKIPSFLAEGRALTNGYNYRASLGQKVNGYDRNMAASVVGFNSGDAKEVLGQFRAQGWKMQSMGTFFVEFMRTKGGGAGIPDIHPRLSKMIGQIGAGTDAEAAFAQEFGAPFAAMQAAFTKHIDDTQANPGARLQGTIWQSIAASAHAEAQEEEDD